MTFLKKELKDVNLSEMDKFYITTPIYYANADPHIGHAYTTVLCDALARWHKLKGNDTFFLTGTDEHGLKIEKEAVKNKKDAQVFVDEYAMAFKGLWEKLNISYDYFIRTTSIEHKKVVQDVLQTLYDNQDIYKGVYEGLYCIGCEQFKNENELAGGKCLDHNIKLEIIKEECYLMKTGKWQKILIQKIENNEFQIKPERYKKEILSFLKSQKLEDVSISRKNLKWGIPLPFDSEHTTYVWIDALLNYLTGIGWDGNIRKMPNYWPADCQVMGKDILRVHTTIWPALLLNLGFALPKLFIHGHILSGGRKMSKTLGNIISPREMLEKFGPEGTKYLLLSGGNFGEDLDLTMERMTDKYNSDLANGLGNLVSRTIKLGADFTAIDGQFDRVDISKKMALFLEECKVNEALGCVWDIIREDNKYIGDNKPWNLKDNDRQKFKLVMQKLFSDLYFISELLIPFLPETAKNIKKALQNGKIDILFPRVNQ